MIENNGEVKFNVKAFDRVVRRIKGNGERFDMDIPLETIDKGSSGVYSRQLDEFRNPPCKTVGCFGGWTCVLNPLDTSIKGIRKNADRVASMGWTLVQEEAIRILGITRDEAETLFHTNTWPSPFKEKYNEAKTIKGEQRVGLARFAAFRKMKLAQARERVAEAKRQAKEQESLTDWAKHTNSANC